MRTKSKKFTRNVMITVAMVSLIIAGISIVNANDVKSIKNDNHYSGIELRLELANTNSNYKEVKDSTAVSESKASEKKCEEKKADSKCEKK